MKYVINNKEKSMVSLPEKITHTAQRSIGDSTDSCCLKLTAHMHLTFENEINVILFINNKSVHFHFVTRNKKNAEKWTNSNVCHGKNLHFI